MASYFPKLVLMFLFLAADVKWDEGCCSGTVYSGEDKLTKLMTEVGMKGRNYTKTIVAVTVM